MKQDNEKYQIFSPDGLPITDEPFENRQAALNYIPQWRERFEHQGYYKAISGRIPLEELTGRLTIVPDSEAVEVMDEINRRQTTWSDGALARLMEYAEDYVRITMSRLGEVPPTLLMAVEKRVSGFSRPDLSSDDKKLEFLTTGRMICIARNVEAAVFCSGGWMRKNGKVTEAAMVRDDPSEQEEVAILIGESRDGKQQKILPVQRSNEKEFLGFGKMQRGIGDTKVIGEFGQFLSPEAPDKYMQMGAQAYLDSKELIKAERKRDQEKGLGRIM